MNISADQAIAGLVQSQADANQQKIVFAIAAKQLDAQKQQGDAIVNLIEQAAVVQEQLNAGRLDVRV